MSYHTTSCNLAVSMYNGTQPRLLARLIRLASFQLHSSIAKRHDEFFSSSLHKHSRYYYYGYSRHVVWPLTPVVMQAHAQFKCTAFKEYLTIRYLIFYWIIHIPHVNFLRTNFSAFKWFARGMSLNAAPVYFARKPYTETLCTILMLNQG